MVRVRGVLARQIFDLTGQLFTELMFRGRSPPNCFGPSFFCDGQENGKKMGDTAQLHGYFLRENVLNLHNYFCVGCHILTAVLFAVAAILYCLEFAGFW